jgi:hypothetical protein
MDWLKRSSEQTYHIELSPVKTELITQHGIQGFISLSNERPYEERKLRVVVLG